MLPMSLEIEWQAWQDWHKEFTRVTGIDINHERCNKLVELTRQWGDTLVALRNAQAPIRMIVADDTKESTREGIHSFCVVFGDVGSVDIVTKGRIQAFVYRGEPNPDGDIVGCYDSTLPTRELTSWEDPETPNGTV